MDTEFSLEELKKQIETKSLKQKDLCNLLDLTQPQVSKVLNGSRALSTSEQKLLKLYFYGIMPFDMLAPKDGYNSQLEFSNEEWRLIDIMANRAGYDDATKWIVSQIRSYLAFCQEQFKIAEQPTTITNLADHKPAKKKANLMAAAGSEIMAEVVDWKAGNNLINVKVTGESMQPTLKDGEVVTMLLREAWEGNNEVRKGMIYLFELDGGLLIKEYNTRPATQEEIDSDIAYKSLEGNMRVRVLLSHNPDFPERIIDNTSIKPIALYDKKFNS